MKINEIDDFTKRDIENTRSLNMAKSMAKGSNMSQMADEIEDKYLSIRDEALRYAQKDGNLDLYQAYVMAIQDHNLDPAMVFDWMRAPEIHQDEDLKDAIPMEAETGGWLQRYEEEGEKRYSTIPDARVKRILSKKKELVDQGMEPEDAQDEAAKFFNVDPEEFDELLSNMDIKRLKKLSGI